VSALPSSSTGRQAAPPSLRTQVMRGGAYLTLRQAAGTTVNVVGVVLLMRTIGPGEYGVYAAAAGLLAALQLVAQMGVGVFLVRAEQGDREEVQQVSSTLLLGSGVAGVLLGAATLPLVERWTRMEELSAVALVVYATLPLSNLAQVPMARLERRLDYRRVALIELAGQLLYFGVALPLAFAGGGAWAPVAGYVSQQVLLWIAMHVAAAYRPRLHWDRAAVGEILAYGAGFTGSIALYQLRKLVNPLVVGRYLGPAAVGIVAVTIQVVTHLAFVSVATWRLSMAALARVQGDRDRLRRAVSEGMRLQTLAVAPFLIAFAWLAPAVVPLILGRAWNEIALVYPFLAVAGLTNALFNLHSSALYVIERNGAMALFHVAHTGLLAGAALLLVPRMGLIGYGVAELVTLASYALLHRLTARSIGSPAYAQTLAIASGVAVALTWPWIGGWSAAGLAVAAIALRPWRDAVTLLSDLRRVAHD